MPNSCRTSLRTRHARRLEEIHPAVNDAVAEIPGAAPDRMIVFGQAVNLAGPRIIFHQVEMRITGAVIGHRRVEFAARRIVSRLAVIAPPAGTILVMVNARPARFDRDDGKINFRRRKRHGKIAAGRRRQVFRNRQQARIAVAHHPPGIQQVMRIQAFRHRLARKGFRAWPLRRGRRVFPGIHRAERLQASARTQSAVKLIVPAHKASSRRRNQDQPQPQPGRHFTRAHPAR